MVAIRNPPIFDRWIQTDPPPNAAKSLEDRPISLQRSIQIRAPVAQAFLPARFAAVRPPGTPISRSAHFCFSVVYAPPGFSAGCPILAHYARWGFLQISP